MKTQPFRTADWRMAVDMAELWNRLRTVGIAPAGYNQNQGANMTRPARTLIHGSLHQRLGSENQVRSADNAESVIQVGA